MITYLSRDSGALFSPCQLLTINELSTLHRSCSSWKSWLETSTLVESNRECIIISSKVSSMLLSGWFIRSIGSMTLRYISKPELKNEASSTYADTLLSLSHLPRLNSLELNDPPISIPIHTLKIAFHSLSNRLTHLNLWLGSERSGNEFLLLVDQLQLLEKLTIYMPIHSPPQLSFSLLPMLDRLHSFHLSSTNYVIFRCSLKQIQYLIQCKSLTSLDAGCWSPG